jgi:hypothetical protein
VTRAVALSDLLALALFASSSSSHGADALDTFVEEPRLADERYRLERLGY